MSQQIKRFYEFDRFRIDLTKRALLCEGEFVQLNYKAFEVLLALVERRGQPEQPATEGGFWCICVLPVPKISSGLELVAVREIISHSAPSSGASKSAGCIIVTDEPHNAGDPVSSGVIPIKSLEGPPERAEIYVRYCRATRRKHETESSIRRIDRRRIKRIAYQQLVERIRQI